MKAKGRGSTEQSSKRDAAPRQDASRKRARKLSEYGKQINEKQKVKEMYYAAALEDESQAKESIPKFSKNTYYAFDGEYWSDELDDYTFLIEDYCETPEKWAGEQGANTEKE